MSSPIARARHSMSRDRLIDLHQNLSHNHRVRKLASELGCTIAALDSGQQQCLDIGCGDMRIAEAIAAACPGSKWECLDLYPLPDGLSGDSRWKKYIQFDGARLPFEDGSRDAALFCDVLHHMPPDVPVQMLREAGRVARYVIVKDHFEYGLWSRSALRAMDFVGNWAYGVSVPHCYFDQATFSDAAREAGLTIRMMRIGIPLYEHLGWAGKMLRDKWQFIAVLSRD